MNDTAKAGEKKTIEKLKISATTYSLVVSVDSFLEQNKPFLIATDEDVLVASTSMKEIANLDRRLEATRKEITEPIDEMKAAWMTYFAGPREKLKAAKTAFGESLLQYEEEQARFQRIEEERIRKAQQEELQRQLAEAEKLRIESEQAEAAKRQRARELEQQGDADAAAALESEAIRQKAEADREAQFLEAVAAEAAEAAEAPIVYQGPAVRAKGVSTAGTHSAVVVDLLTLVKAVAEGKAPIECLKVDQVFLNSQARAFKQNLNYPGVDYKFTRSVRA